MGLGWSVSQGDTWTREGDLDRIGQFVELVKGQGIIAGVAGHELRTPMAVEKAGIKPDFYMKTFHSANDWSARKPDQMKEVIDAVYWGVVVGGQLVATAARFGACGWRLDRRRISARSRLYAQRMRV